MGNNQKETTVWDCSTEGGRAAKSNHKGRVDSPSPKGDVGIPGEVQARERINPDKAIEG